MKVIPVIDVLNGKVVHAVRGNRSEYKPIQSVLGKSFDPIEVAKMFDSIGFVELYVADLDAIIDCSMNFQLFRHMVNQTGLKLMVDAGITNIERAHNLIESGVSEIVIGTETLQSKGFVAEAVRQFGKEHVIVSLDLKDDKVIVKTGFDGYTDPINLLAEFKEMGVSKVIILDLSRVGSDEGINVKFVKNIKEATSMDVYVGGGVRGIDDLIKLNTLNVSGALVASALHSGKITIDELRQNSFI